MERRLEATETARALFENSSGAVLGDPSRVFSPGAGAATRQTRQYATEMTVDLGGGSSARQGVVVEFGLPEHTAEAITFDLAWRPVSHSQLLPVFRGSFEMMPEGCRPPVRRVDVLAASQVTTDAIEEALGIDLPIELTGPLRAARELTPASAVPAVWPLVDARHQASPASRSSSMSPQFVLRTAV